MTYEDVSKISFLAGFNEGIRNIRTLKQDKVKLTFAFSEENPNIDEFYISVGIRNCSNSIYSVVIKESDKDLFKDKLTKTVKELKTMTQKFTEEIESRLEQLRDSNVIKMWS